MTVATRLNLKEITGRISKEALDKMSNQFVIMKRGTSGWVKDGYKYDDKNAPVIDCTASTTIPIKSQVWDGEYGFRETMYVRGARTIFVRSIRDPKTNEIIDRGLDADYPDLDKERVASMKLGIRFKSGVLDISEYGSDPILKEYLATHENNIDRPNFQELKSMSKATSFFNFKALQKEKKAIEVIDKVAEKHDIMGRVLALRKQDGKKTAYDTQKIDTYLDILNIAPDCESDAWEQKLYMLIGFATAQPLNFKKAIDDTLDEVKMVIGKANNLKVITLGNDKASFAGVKEPFYTAPKATEYSLTENLALYFASKEGRENFGKLQELVISASVEASKN